MTGIDQDLSSGVTPHPWLGAGAGHDEVWSSGSRPDKIRAWSTS
jgi:hypothetical protein